MNYLNVENISKSYGELELFQDISFSVHKDQKIAFVAKNGTGKTSILNILARLDTPDSGQVIFRKDIVVSFLTQEPKLDQNLSIEETIFSSDNNILQVIKSYEEALLNPEDTDFILPSTSLADSTAYVWPAPFPPAVNPTAKVVAEFPTVYFPHPTDISAL